MADFHVYPDPQTNPLSVPAASDGPLVAIEELVGTASGPFGLNTMFVRVTMIGAPGAPDPTFFLKAGGAEKQVTLEGTTVPIPGTSNPEVANATVYAEANDVFRIEIYVFQTPNSWQLRIHNNDAAARTFAWVVGKTLANSLKPWIDIPDALDWDADIGLALTGQDINHTIVATNWGSGPLTISNAAGPIGASPFEIISVPGPIAPNSAGNLVVRFNTPSTPGSSTTALTLTSDDPTAVADNPAAAHNKKASLTAKAAQVEVVMVLDISGSMAYTPDGSAVAVAESDARWGKLKVAAKQFLDLLADFGGGMGRVAIILFPDLAVADTPRIGSSKVLQAAIAIPADTSALQTLLDVQGPQAGHGWTPIGHGIGNGMGTTAGSFGQFQGAPNNAFNRRVMVVMSDGGHNADPPHPNIFYGAGPTSFTGKLVRPYTVAYGDPGAISWPPDHALMQTIGAEDTGEYFDAGADDLGMDLLKNFRAALTQGLALDPTSDPSGVLTAGAPEVRRHIAILPYDTKVSFVVSWGTFDEERIGVQLITPNCELITPAVAKADPHIAYHAHERYAIYTVDSNYLANTAAPQDPRYGDWTLIITAGSLEGSDRETYEYEVITESRLRMRLDFDRARYYAGDTIGISARLTLDGAPITGATVTLRLEAPGQFIDNWLAGVVVTAQEYEKASTELAGADVTPLAIKAHAIKQIKGLDYAVIRRPRTIAMTDPDGTGVYSATISSSSVPGAYKFHVTAIGQTDEGIAFRREKQANQYLDVRPDPLFTLVDIVYALIEDDDERVHVADVRVWPRDRFGNVKLIQGDLENRLAIAVQGAEFSGPLVNNLDASYSRPIRYLPGSRPTISVAVEGEDVVKSTPIAPVADLVYASRVVEFTVGGEAAPGANQHRDPTAALGDITAKGADDFVALGGLGALAVAPGDVAVVASGADDVTVFVRGDETRRAYRVEALTTGSPGHWVEIGSSEGVTQSFSLGAARLRAARAIRVSDTSGRTRTGDFQPSSSPGASIRGIGFAKVGPAPAEPRGCLGWLMTLWQAIRDRIR